MFDLNAALNEITTKSESQIQIETAYKWASRAIICYRLFSNSRELKLFAQAVDYHHEAIEHAASAEDDCKTLHKIEEVLQAEARRAQS